MKDKPDFFRYKDQFTLKQFTAFSLAYNQALQAREQQERGLSLSLLYKRIYRNLKNLRPQSTLEEITQKKTIKNFRNYFSHYLHEDLNKNHYCPKDIKNYLSDLIIESTRECIENKRKIDSKNEENNKKIYQILEEANKSPDTLFNLNLSFDLHRGSNQPILALLIAPFLTRDQTTFLIDKIYWGDKKKDHKDDPKRMACKEIIRGLSSNPSTVQTESFIDNKIKQGISIQDRLRHAFGMIDKNNEEKEKMENYFIQEGFPEDHWFMRQMVFFLENMDKASCLSFARIETYKDGEGHLEQKIVFSGDDRILPLRIKYNTIEVRVKTNNDGEILKGVLGINTLKYLVLAALKDLDIDNFIIAWHSENQQREKSKKEYGSKDRLKKRIDYCIENIKSMRQSERLYKKIRFIVDKINKAYFVRNGKSLNKKNFQVYMSRVRCFNRNELKKALHEDDLLNVKGVGLGKNNEKTLNDLINTNDLETFSQNILSESLKRLDFCQENFEDMRKKEELEALKKDLKMRMPKNRGKDVSSQVDQVGMPSSAVREKFFNDSKKKKFFNLTQEFSLRDILKFSWFSKENIEKPPQRVERQGKRNIRKERESWARSQLLWLMSKKLVSHEIKEQNIDQLQRPSDTTIKISLGGGYEISCKMTQKWKNYSDYDPKYLKKLIDVYMNRSRNVSLLEVTSESQDSPLSSIQGALKEMRKERFILLQSFLKWEKQIVKKQGIKLKESHLEFDEICKRASIGKNGLSKYRNACFHEDILNKRFSEVSEPIKSIYDQLVEERRRARKEKKKEAYKK